MLWEINVPLIHYVATQGNSAGMAGSACIVPDTGHLELIQWAGGVDPIGQVGQPSRVLKRWKNLLDANPDILLVACCGMNEERTKSVN